MITIFAKALFCRKESFAVKKAGRFLREVFGSLLYAVGMYNFAIAANLPLSGFPGVAFIVNRLTSIPVGWAIMLLNVPVAALCFKVLGLGFFWRSVRCTILSSLMLDYLAPLLPVYSGERLLAALSTGVLTGMGLALIYTANSSTGGMDFITVSVKRRWPYLPLGKINLAFDVAVIAIEGFMLRDIDGFIYGILVSFIMSVVVDKTIFGLTSSKLALIVTNCGREICGLIEDTCHRGSTLVPAFGGYKGDGRQIVVSACSTQGRWWISSTPSKRPTRWPFDGTGLKRDTRRRFPHRQLWRRERGEIDL